MTHQADDLSGDRPETPKKRTFILGEPDAGNISPHDIAEEIEDPPIETYDDVYDDIDDIDDFDAFEMDNGLTDEELKPETQQQSAPQTTEQDDRHEAPSVLSWNRPPEISPQAGIAQSLGDDDDIRPVPLKRTTPKRATPPDTELDPQIDEIPGGRELSFKEPSSEKVSSTAPHAEQDRRDDLLPENVFAETDRLLEATTRISEIDRPAANQPGEPAPSLTPKPSDPRPVPAAKPEQEDAEDTSASNHAPADGPTFGLLPPHDQASYESLFLPPAAIPSHFEPSGDITATQIIAEAGRIRRFAAAVIGDEDEADHLVEATLEHAIANPSDLTTDFDLGVSLLTVLYQKRLEKLRKFDQLLMPSLSPSFNSVLFQRLPGADRDEIRDFAEAICSLGEDDRTILVLISLENLGYHEVAEVLGIDVDRVMPKISQAREQLRYALDTTASDANSGSTFGEIA